LISIFVATGLLVSHYFFYKVCLVIRNAIMWGKNVWTPKYIFNKLLTFWI
jgi:hypothetical protein